MQQLAQTLANGMESVIRSRGREWDVYLLGNRAGYRFARTPPRNNQEAGAYDLPPVRHLQRVFMANRCIWDFGWWGGPAISAQTTSEDVDVYVGVFAEFIEQLLA
jgi:glutamate-1-semialdehyde aminotransferase